MLKILIHEVSQKLHFPESLSSLSSPTALNIHCSVAIPSLLSASDVIFFRAAGRLICYTASSDCPPPTWAVFISSLGSVITRAEH